VAFGLPLVELGVLGSKVYFILSCAFWRSPSAKTHTKKIDYHSAEG
jgi:hypothetical protein